MALNITISINNTLPLQFIAVFVIDINKMETKEIKMECYSNYFEYEQETIEQVLKEAGINYRIEPFSRTVKGIKRPLNCFYLFIEKGKRNMEFNMELGNKIHAVELEVMQKYRNEFWLAYLTPFEIQELVQYSQ